MYITSAIFNPGNKTFFCSDPIRQLLLSHFCNTPSSLINSPIKNDFAFISNSVLFLVPRFPYCLVRCSSNKAGGYS
jgi:hypothetical protein